MPAASFSEVWRRVRLYAGNVPAHLAREWVQSVYGDVCGRRHWAWLRAETLLTTRAARALTATLLQGSTAFVAPNADLVDTDVGRQIRVAKQSIYTIDTVEDASNATLTVPYAGVSDTVSMSIHDRYLVMPEDFRSIHTVTDLQLQRPIAWWISKDRLDLFDPGRIAGDSRFRVLVAGAYAVASAVAGRVAYEAWPAPSAAGTYGLAYFKQSDSLPEDDPLPGVLGTRTDVLVEGALARCAMWPGTPTEKNPYFNPALARLHTDRFDRLTKQLDVLDDDQYLMDLQQVNLAKYGLAAISADTTLMRQSDATMADYY